MGIAASRSLVRALGQRSTRRLLAVLLISMVGGSVFAQTEGQPKRILWSTLFDHSSLEDVQLKYPASFQWSRGALPRTAAAGSNGTTEDFVLKPSDDDVKQGLARFQVGDGGAILSIPTFQFHRRPGKRPSLVKVDLTVFSVKLAPAELRSAVQADLARQFGQPRTTKSGAMPDYGQMQFTFFEESGTGRVICLTQPQDTTLPLSITYSFPGAGQDKWATEKRC